MPLLMLIEDEPLLRSAIARYLGRLPGLGVIDTGLVADAIRLLDTERPDVVVSDLDLPDGSGLDVLAALDRHGLEIPVLFVSGHLDTFRSQIPARDDVELHEKPFPLSELREAVMRHLPPAPPQRPERPSPFALRDYVQLACMGGHTVDLEAVQGDAVVGRIRIHEGTLWSAAFGETAGEAALSDLFGLVGASARIVRRTGDPGDREFERRWAHVLLDAERESRRAARRLSQRPDPLSEPPDSTDDRPAAHSGDTRDDFTALLDRGLDAMLQRDYATAWAALSRADALRPGVGSVRTNLARLRALGVDSN